MRFHLLPCYALVVLIGGCGREAISAEQNCHSIDPSERTGTAISELLPLTLPTLDSASLFTRADTAIIYVYYGSDSIPEIVQLEVAGEFDPPDLRRAEATLEEVLPQHRPEGTRSYGMLVHDGRVRVEPFELTSVCEPVLLNEGELRQAILNKSRELGRLPIRSIDPVLLVDSRGLVVDVLFTSDIGSANLSPVIEALQLARFTPALWNGVAVSTRIGLPVTFSPPADLFSDSLFRPIE